MLIFRKIQDFLVQVITSYLKVPIDEPPARKISSYMCKNVKFRRDILLHFEFPKRMAKKAPFKNGYVRTKI